MPSYSFYNDKSIGGVQRECTSSGELVGFAVYRNVTVPGDPDKCDTKAFRKKFDTTATHTLTILEVMITSDRDLIALLPETQNPAEQSDR